MPAVVYKFIKYVNNIYKYTTFRFRYLIAIYYYKG